MIRTHALAAGLLACCLAGTAVAQDVPEGYPAEYASIIEGSRAEKGVLIYSNMSADRWGGVLAGFGEQYPWINVSTLDMSSGEVFQRFQAETGAGQQSADLVVNVGPSLWIEISEAGLLEPYVSPEAGAYPDSMKPLPGVYTILGDPLLFVWNKATLPEAAVPTSLKDLAEKAAANPDTYRGKIATYPADRSAFGFAGHFAATKHHGEVAWEWYKTLAPLTRFETSSGPMIEKLTVGEYSLLYFAGSASTWAALADPARGELLGWSYVADGTPINGRPAAVSAKAQSPNSAKLLLDYMLSEEGQRAWAGADRMIVRPDIDSASLDGGFTYGDVVAAVGEENALMIDYERDQVEGYQAFIDRWLSLSQ